MFLLFGSTLVVKIKKTQESTPIILKRITEDKENIILLPVDYPLSLNLPKPSIYLNLRTHLIMWIIFVHNLTKPS